MTRNDSNKQGVCLPPPRQPATVVSGIMGYLTVRDGSRPYECATGPNNAPVESLEETKNSKLRRK